MNKLKFFNKKSSKKFNDEANLIKNKVQMLQDKINELRSIEEENIEMNRTIILLRSDIIELTRNMKRKDKILKSLLILFPVAINFICIYFYSKPCYYCGIK